MRISDLKNKLWRLQNDLHRYFKFFIQRRTRGWDDSELWSLDITIAKFVHPRLEEFNKRRFSYPSHLKEKEWNDKIEDIIYAMKIIKEERHLPGTSSDIDFDRLKRGLSYFGESFTGLWI